MDERQEAQASIYVLGALEPKEQREFEEAMQTDSDLRQLVQELRGTVAAMTFAFPRTQPPAALKERILGVNEVSPDGNLVATASGDDGMPPWMAWMPWAMAACFAILCVVLISLGNVMREQSIVLNEQLTERVEEALELNKKLELLQAKSAQQTTNFQERILTIQRDAVKRIEDLNRQTTAFTNRYQTQQAEVQRQLSFFRNQAEQLRGDKQALEAALASGGSAPGNNRLNNSHVTILRATDPQARAIGAALYSSQDQSVIVTMENLAPLPPSQNYQLWLIDSHQRTPISAGILSPDASGNLRMQLSPATRVDAAERMAVSIEPRGGSTSPTGRIVMASN